MRRSGDVTHRFELKSRNWLATKTTYDGPVSIPLTDRRLPPKRDPRAVLLETGARLFAAHGYEAVSIADIAEAAGVAKGLLYYYFDSKRGLYVEILRMISDELAAISRPDPSIPAADRTAAVLDAVIQWAKQYGTSLWHLFMQGAGSDPELAEILRTGSRRQVDMMLAGMNDIQSELGLPPIPETPALRHAIRGWTAFIEATLVDWLEHPDLTETELRDLFLHAAGALISAARRTTRD